MADTLTQYDSTYDERTALLDEDETIQHGIDGDPSGDAEKGATGGALGGAIVGATAGAILSPAGAVLGAIVGGVAGGLASGAAVAYVDRHDNDNTVSGVGSTPGYVDPADPYVNSSDIGSAYTTTLPSGSAYSPTLGVGVPGIADLPSDEEYDLDRTNRSTWEEAGAPVIPSTRADTFSEPDGFNGETVPVHDNTYATTSAANSGIGTGFSKETELGERTASFKTGGVANDGTPDTRGIGEKFVDGLTGDDVDDKTGSIVNHP